MSQHDDKWIKLAKIIFERDPSAHSWQEVYDLYPSIKALRAHAEAHKLFLLGNYYEARHISELARQETGIEIHPGAKLSDLVFIDHGMGVVIGETAIIGKYVTIYHGVTLGAIEGYPGKRHPTVEDYVEIGAGAILLGDITIGHHSKIGAGAVVLQDVPPYSTAVGVPARIIIKRDRFDLSNNEISPLL